MMARLYADEQFPQPVVECLRCFGHDILTVRDADQDNRGIPDEAVLAFATRNNRAVLTINRDDFVRLHRSQPNHAGIIVCSQDLDWEGQARRINEAIIKVGSLQNTLVRVNRPQN